MEVEAGRHLRHVALAVDRRSTVWPSGASHPNVLLTERTRYDPGLSARRRTGPRSRTGGSGTTAPAPRRRSCRQDVRSPSPSSSAAARAGAGCTPSAGRHPGRTRPSGRRSTPGGAAIAVRDVLGPMAPSVPRGAAGAALVVSRTRPRRPRKGAEQVVEGPVLLDQEHDVLDGHVCGAAPGDGERSTPSVGLGGRSELGGPATVHATTVASTARSDPPRRLTRSGRVRDGDGRGRSSSRVAETNGADRRSSGHRPQGTVSAG